LQNYQQKKFWLKKQKEILTKKNGKPISSKVHKEYSKKILEAENEKFQNRRRRKNHSVQVTERLILPSKRAIMPKKSKTGREGRKSVNFFLTAGREKFKFTNNHGGYFHQYEYIEDPGIKKEKVLKNEAYRKRRYEIIFYRNFC